MVCSQALVPLGKPLKQIAQVDIDLGGPFHAGTYRIEDLIEIRRQRILQVGWEDASREFVLDRNRRLLSPDGKLLRAVSLNIQAILFFFLSGQTHCRDGQEHDHKLLLTKHRMSCHRVDKPDQTPPSLFEEGIGIGCQVSAIDFQNGELWLSGHDWTGRAGP